MKKKNELTIIKSRYKSRVIGLCLWIIPAIIVSVLATLAFSYFQRENANAVNLRNEEYIKDFTVSLAEKLNENFENAQIVIKSLAVLNAEDVVMGCVEAETLAKLEVETQFDHIRYVDKDGISHTSSGTTADVSDRWYFIDGMKGNCGTTFVTNSRLTDQRQIGFYAPAITDGEIVGVVVAFYDEESIIKSLDYYFYGEKSSVGIITTDGVMIVNSPADDLKNAYEHGYAEDFCDFVLSDAFDAKKRNRIITAYERRMEMGFEYTLDGATTMGYIAPLECVELNVYMTFPEKAANTILGIGYRAGRRLQTSLILIFGSLFLYLIILGLVRLGKEKDRNRLAKYIADAENAVSRGLIVVNSAEGTYENFSSMEMPIHKKGQLFELKEYLLSRTDNEEHAADISRFVDEDIMAANDTEDFPTIIIKREEKTGQEVFYSLTYVPVEQKGGKVTKGVVLFRDVTTEKQKERQILLNLQEALDSVKEASRAKSEFLFNMSYDIKTPISTIVESNNLIAKNVGDREKCLQNVDRIGNAGRSLMVMVNDVLEMARIESGRVSVAETPWSTELFNDTLFSIFEKSMTEKNIEFTRSIDVEHEYVFCDAIKVREIYINILSNALKYTDDGGKVDISLKEIPSDRPGFAKYQTTVSDTGIGMSEEYMNKMFKEFSRERTIAECGIEGTGLGLYIVKRLIDILDGSLDIQSEKGVGTTVVVTLYHRIAERSDLLTAKEIHDTSVWFAGKRILLAEDNDLNAELTTELLNAAGIEVERVADGSACAKQVSISPSGYYDLVLMDIQMPATNGYDATRIIRNLPAEDKARIPIIALTANSSEEDRLASFEAGMQGHISKPIDAKLLIEELKKWFI